MKVAAVQLVSSDNYQENLYRVSVIVSQAAEKDAELVVLPEYCLRYGVNTTPSKEEQYQFIADLSVLAQEHKLWLAAGTFPIQENATHANGEKPYAACVIFDSNGEIQGQYNKIHLFDADVIIGKEKYRESDCYRPGREITCVDTPWGKMGVVICFDLRFSEVFSKLRAENCDFIVAPSAFTAITGRAHWEILVRSRAIETQLFVIATNQGGKHFDNTQTWGHTMIVNPWGTVVGQLERGEGYVLRKLDLQEVKNARNRIPMVPRLAKQ